MKYRFSDLADMPKLQELMGSLYWLTDIAIGIIDVDGTFLFCAGWRGSCTAGSQKACDCHTYLSSHLDPVSYTYRRCSTGMVHYASPIVVEGEHLASVYIGQFFTEPPDDAAIALESSTRGLDPVEYRKALGKFSIISPMRLSLLLKYIRDLANMLADIGLQRRKQMETLEILRLNEERLQYLSCHDPLTGLLNRICFEDTMAALDAEPVFPITIMVIDLDGLKQINDSLGHPSGDELLQAAAEIFKDSAPPESLLARIGGDEFAILLPRTNFDTAQAISRRIHTQTDHYNALIGEMQLGVSIGIAIAYSPPFTMHKLFKEADADMYREKTSRKQLRPTVDHKNASIESERKP